MNQTLAVDMPGFRCDLQVSQYREDGAAVLRGVLDLHMIAEAERVFQWSINNPSAAEQRYYEASGTVFHQPAVAKESTVGFNREDGDSRNMEDFYVGLKPGDPFRNPAFVQVRPTTAAVS